MATIARILELAPTCCYLADNNKYKKALFGGVPKMAQNQAMLIYIYWKVLNTIYELDNDYDGLYAPAQYLYELEQKFAYKAAAIVDGSGGGSVATASSSSRPEQLNFTVAASGTTLINGQSTVTLTQFTGYNLLVDKNGQPMTQIITAPLYYTWNRNTGVLTLSSAAVTGDEFQITPA